MLHGDSVSCQQDVCVRGVRSNASGVSVVSFHQGVYSVLLAMCLPTRSVQCHVGNVWIVMSVECFVSCQHGVCLCVCGIF